jgi:hypothetical protein
MISSKANSTECDIVCHYKIASHYNYTNYKNAKDGSAIWQVSTFLGLYIAWHQNGKLMKEKGF